MMPQASASPMATSPASPPTTANAPEGRRQRAAAARHAVRADPLERRERARTARVGALVAPFTDPFSGQPENKATPASIAPYEYVFRGFALSRKPLELPAQPGGRASLSPAAIGYLFADNADLAGWQSWLTVVAGERSRRIQGFWRRRLSRGIVCRRPHRDLPVHRPRARCRRLGGGQEPVRRR